MVLPRRRRRKRYCYIPDVTSWGWFFRSTKGTYILVDEWRYLLGDLPDVTSWGGVFPGDCRSSHSDRRHGRSPGSVWSPRTRPSATPWAWPRTADTSSGPDRASSPRWWGEARSEKQTPRIITDIDIDIKWLVIFILLVKQGAQGPHCSLEQLVITVIKIAFGYQIQNV